jgi:hypothetical protein
MLLPPAEFAGGFAFEDRIGALECECRNVTSCFSHAEAAFRAPAACAPTGFRHATGIATMHSAEKNRT